MNGILSTTYCRALFVYARSRCQHSSVFLPRYLGRPPAMVGCWPLCFRLGKILISGRPASLTPAVMDTSAVHDVPIVRYGEEKENIQGGPGGCRMEDCGNIAPGPIKTCPM
ncbi:hypothetical protein GGR56DRAFT_473006 [Xylariaceae sp. FL0804]|nr:hypothetical protein GGR56DRAFT_473006 [Xylariaceae sp. FL0804]